MASRDLETDRAIRSMQIGAIEIGQRDAALTEHSMGSILQKRKAEHDKNARIAQRNWLKRQRSR